MVGGLLGWDDPDRGLGSRAATLRDRLPPDLLRRGCGPDFAALPMVGLYMTDDEYAAEIANQTMHGIMHVSVIEQQDGSLSPRMAVLVKTNGRLGDAYMAAIKPFRHLIIYPVMMREGQEMWDRMFGASDDAATNNIDGPSDDRTD